MKIIGIHDGHNSCASYVDNGVIIDNLQEERLTRNKNEIDFPYNSLKEIFLTNSLKTNEIDSFVFSSNFMHEYNYLRKYIEWHSAGEVQQVFESQKSEDYLNTIFKKRRDDRIKILLNQFDISKDKVFFEDHHTSHAAAAYYTSNYKYDDNILILTCDGAGDGISSTVSIGYKNKIKMISKTGRNASLGKIFSRVTHYLGFKPWEHEYKLMGLAPYGNKDRGTGERKIIVYKCTRKNRWNNVFFCLVFDFFDNINFAFFFFII